MKGIEDRDLLTLMSSTATYQERKVALARIAAASYSKGYDDGVLDLTGVKLPKDEIEIDADGAITIGLVNRGTLDG